jgi:hypothetical protein
MVLRWADRRTLRLAEIGKTIDAGGIGDDATHAS